MSTSSFEADFEVAKRIVHIAPVKNIDRFFGETASIADLSALWPARNAEGRPE